MNNFSASLEPRMTQHTFPQYWGTEGPFSGWVLIHKDAGWRTGAASYPNDTLQQRTLRHAPVHQQLQADQLRRRAPRAGQVLVHALVRAHDVVAPAVVVAVHLLPRRKETDTAVT